MAYKMKGFPMMTGTALYQEAYKETRRVKRRRSKNRIAQNELSRLEGSLEKLTERFGENPSDAQKDRLADLRFRIQKAREVADKRQAKYDKVTGRTTKKSDPSENEVDHTEPNKDANEMLAENLEEEEYDTAPENKIEELPDVSAEKIHKNLLSRTGFNLGVIINDSIGRAWRNGTIGTAIGVAGLPAILDLKGREDLIGNPLKVSEQAIADELASAASLIQGQADEALPVVLIKGFKTLFDNIPASGLIRDIKKDLFL